LLFTQHRETQEREIAFNEEKLLQGNEGKERKEKREKNLKTKK